MHIGELSRTARVSIHTLGFYEREKLLREPPRTPGGYRSYEEQDLARVRFIRDTQQLGFTLKEIREPHETANAPSNPRASGRPNWQEAFRIARQRLVLIDRKIDELQAFRRRLASGLDGSGRNQFEACPAARPAKPSRKRPALSASPSRREADAL